MENIPRDLIAKAATGETAAFREIYEKTSVFVYNVALRITGKSNDACDVTQDVFIKVYKNLHKFGFLSSFKTWLYRITVNTAINYKKSEKKHMEKRTDYNTVANSVFTEETARESVDKESGRERVSVLLDALNPEQRACVILREIEGMTYREIASALGTNINTVRTRIKRAREKLMASVGKG
ncbi:MAG: RNA polymerase sigma factor [Candidatus Omnitrophica bacterium]|nr:RNA polymerase sigma factor [Candidatus Omnitrophota bacterium]